MTETKGDLIEMANEGHFDVIVHGCNCFCKMGSGIAPQIKHAFPDAWRADNSTKTGDIMKLGCYTEAHLEVNDRGWLSIINAYTQYGHDATTKPLDYEALTLSLRKINKNYRGKTIGLPKIGAGLAGGDWDRIKKIIETELNAMDIVIVHYDK